MPLRRRLSIIAAASVGIAILVAAVVCYVVVRSQLRGQVDDSLRAQMQSVQRVGGSALQSLPGVSPSAGGPAPYAQVVLPNGRALGLTDVTHLRLPVTAHDRQIAATQRGISWSDVQIGKSHLRVLTFPGGNSDVGVVALQLARPLNSVDNILSNLRLILLFVLIGGVFVAGTLGRIASRRVLKPLKEVEQTAQHIAQTDDLSNRIHVHADDEVGRLASRFNQMLDRLQGSRDALDESVRAQRQLVADASHELRTPVTSLRTNIEILLASDEMDTAERHAMLTDVVEQSEELAALVNDLIELARGDEPGTETDDVRLDWIAEEALSRARRNAPSLHFAATIEPALLDGVPERLGRALNNLLDNASRHSPAGGTIEVYAGPGGVRVRDHGEGVADGDLPYLFDRFYRGENARGRQGSGLGLAIVRQVSEQHGGTASVANAPDGGAIFTLRLPASSPDAHHATVADAPTAQDTRPLRIS
ncbi:MAG TPA: HAMP domain-containing sensor histidine kinase [Solirubrobacteraceae bacterium]|nr:HAMP domain-containing sensor histidine kinase [Solirubrobacteraceae bacterium]